MTETLQCLQKHGQRLDLEIAKELRMSVALVRQQLTALAESHQAIVCKTIQFEKGRQFEAWQGRVSGYVPPASPGRKPKPKA
jgi:predicted ArsR family transcriptional regulator